MSARLMILGLLPLAACLPWHEVYREAASGRVLDGQGGPIAGARVQICSRDNSENGKVCRRRQLAVSDRNGAFGVQRYRDWQYDAQDAVRVHLTTITACSSDANLAASVDLPLGQREVRLIAAPVTPEMRMTCAALLGR